jgi:flagellar biosynthesis GTPase FlhF
MHPPLFESALQDRADGGVPKKYGSPYLSSIVWTKLDESCSFGAIVDQGIFMDLPASGLSTHRG